MSDDLKTAGLDAQIDAVLRDAMRGDGPADLRRRVMAELRTKSPSSPGWLGARLVPALGVMVGMAVVLGLLIIAWPVGPPSGKSAAVASPPPATVGSTPAPSPIAEPESERSRGVGDRSVAAAVARPVRPRRPRVSDPPGWRDSALEQLALERIELPLIVRDETPQATDIVLVDLDMPPVEAETPLPLTNQ